MSKAFDEFLWQGTNRVRAKYEPTTAWGPGPAQGLKIFICKNKNVNFICKRTLACFSNHFQIMLEILLNHRWCVHDCAKTAISRGSHVGYGYATQATDTKQE